MNIIKIFNFICDTVVFYLSFNILFYNFIASFFNSYILLASMISSFFIDKIIHPKIDPNNFTKKSIVICGIPIFLQLWYNFIYNYYNILTIYYVITSTVFGIIASDFFSGLFHWFGDLISEHTNFSLFSNFKTHHQNPYLTLSQSIWSLFFDVLTIGIFAMYMFNYLWVYIVSTIILFSNVIHQYSHMPQKNIPFIVKKLQDYRIILHPKSHREHHKPPYNKKFCIVNGWCNILDNVNFWYYLENYFALPIVYLIK